MNSLYSYLWDVHGQSSWSQGHGCIVESRPKKWKDLLIEVVLECDQVLCTFPIPKWHLSFIHIQLNTDPFRVLLHLQHCALICKGSTHAFAQSYTPHATVCTQCELLFPCHRLLTHTHNPRGAVADNHFPSVFPRSVTFGTQDEEARIKALGVVGGDQWLTTFFDGRQVSIHAQQRGGCVWIKHNRICRRDNTCVRGKAFQVTSHHLLTEFDMFLQAFPDLEAQSPNMFSHIQKRVVRVAPVFMSPLGSRRDSNTWTCLKANGQSAEILLSECD